MTVVRVTSLPNHKLEQMRSLTITQL